MQYFSNNIKSFCLNRRVDNKIWYSVIINLLLWFIASIFFDTKYYLDDYRLHLLVSGQYTGQPENIIPFIHPIQAFLLSGFYKMIPAINWYIVFINFALWLGSVVMLYIFLDEIGKKAIPFYLIWYYCFMLHAMINISYNIASAFAATMGAFFLERLMEKQSHDRWKYILSLLLLFIGFSWRVNAAIMGIGITLPLVFLSWMMREKKIYWKRYIAWCIVIVMFAIPWLCTNKMTLNINDDWKYYAEYNYHRNVVMFSPQIYLEGDDRFDDVYLEQIDIGCYKNRITNDIEIFSLEHIKEYSEIITEQVTGEFDEKILLSLIRYEWFPIFLVLIVMGIIFTHQKLVWIAELLLIITVQLYLSINGKIHIYYLDYSLMLNIFLLNEYFYLKEIDKKKSKSTLIILLLCCIIIAPSNYYHNTMSDTEKQFISELENNQDGLYIIDIKYEQDVMIQNASIIEQQRVVGGTTWCSLGGWFQEIPYEKEKLKRYGINNVIKESINNDEIKILLSNEKTQLMRNLIKKHYDKTAYLELVQQVPYNQKYGTQFGIYRVKTR